MMEQQWKAGYPERGKSGLGRGLSKPTVETQRGGFFLLYYMAVTGYQGAYIAVLIGGNHFQWQFVARDEELISMLTQLESDFWNHVQDATPPPLDGSDASSDFLSSFFPNSVPSSIALPTQAEELIEQYRRFSEEAAIATEKKQEVENLLKQMLGENETGTVGDSTVVWKTVSQERLDTKTLKAEHPVLFKRYTNQVSFRRFSVKKGA